MAKNNMAAAKNTVILFMAIILRHIVAAYARMKLDIMKFNGRNMMQKRAINLAFFDARYNILCFIT